MLKYGLIGAAALAAIVVPALAQHGGMEKGPMTRSAVEAKVKERFAMMDANRDGFVAKGEVEAMHAGKMKERQDQHFAEMDANKDGSISRAEFDAGHAARAEGHEGKQGGKHHGMRAMHRGMGAAMGGGAMLAAQDADKDGRVSLAEALTRPLAMFDRADVNKDGTVTPEERKAARETMRSEWRAKRG